MPTKDDTQRILLPKPIPARRWPHLVVVEGGDAGSVFRLLNPETTIGRSPDADVCLPYGTVSRHHAVVKLVGDEATIEDLGSYNGTFVDMNRVTSPWTLKDGDHIGLGDVTLLKLTYGIVLDDALRRSVFETASHDVDTATASTLYFLDRLRGEHAFARRHHAPLTFVFFRVERGQVVPRQDEALRYLARVIRETVRVEDLLARAGGNQLVALLRSNKEQAFCMAARVRTQLGVGQQPFNVSMAIVPLRASADVAPETILVAANEQSQRAFAAGVDRIVTTDSVLFEDEGTNA